nr:MAG TPA: hypothetical protein [Caudoviricetes sp.]
MSGKNNVVNDSSPADTSSIPYLMCIGKQVGKEFLWPEKKRAHSPALSPTTATLAAAARRSSPSRASAGTARPTPAPTA